MTRNQARDQRGREQESANYCSCFFMHPSLFIFTPSIAIMQFENVFYIYKKEW